MVAYRSWGLALIVLAVMLVGGLAAAWLAALVLILIELA